MQSIWQFDLETFRAIHVGLHRDWLDPIFWLISTSGLGWVQVILVLTIPLIFAGKVAKDQKPGPKGALMLLLQGTWRRWSNPAFLAGPLIAVIAISGLFFAGVVKQIMNRERPSHLAFAHPQEDIYSRSYPSGHTTTSFAIAFMLLYVTWGTKHAWVGRIALLWAALVGFSRVYRGVHWPTDVLGGMFAGLITASLVYLVMRKGAKEVEKTEGS